MDVIRRERERVLSRLLSVLSIAGAIAFVPSVYLSVISGYYVLAAVDTVAYLCVLVVSFVPRFGYTAKLWTIILTCLVLGVAVLFSTGAYGAGYVWLIAGIVLSALFGRLGITIATFAVSFIAMAAYGIAVSFGFDGQGLTVPSVAVIGSNLFVVCLTLALVIHRIQGNLEHLANERRILSEHLTAELSASETIRRNLSTALAEKETLIRELHHRVNNNMQFMMSLIELEKDDAEPDTITARRIKTLSAANAVILLDENAAGALLTDLVSAVLDCAAEPALRHGDAAAGLPRLVHPDPDANRFLDPQTAILFALCLSDLLNSDFRGCRASRIEAAEHGTKIRVSVVFEQGCDSGAIGSAAEKLMSGILAAAGAGSVAFSLLPPHGFGGPGDRRGSRLGLKAPQNDTRAAAQNGL